MAEARRRPPMVGRIVGALFAVSWLSWVFQDVLRRRRGEVRPSLHADLLAYGGMGLTLLAPVLSHRNRFFGRLPHHPAQKAMVGTGVAMDWAALGLTATGASAGPLSPVLLFRLGMALMLESPFVFLVLTVPALVPLIRRVAGSFRVS